MKRKGAESQDLGVMHIWIPIQSLPFNFCVALGK